MKKDNLSFHKIAITALVSTFNQVIADYGYFRAISMTSASSGIVIFNLSSIFAYVLSLLILPSEKFSWIKLTSVILAFGGGAAITFSDESNNTAPPGAPAAWIGDVTMAAAALFWALYLVCYKKFIWEPSFGSINLQGTLMGLFCTFFLWPIVIILHWTNVEPLFVPSNFIIGLILATTGLAFINNYLFTFGTAVTSPVFVTIGGMLAIPASALVDWLFHGAGMNVWKIIGTVIMAIAFLIINIDIPVDKILGWFPCSAKYKRENQIVIDHEIE